MVGYTIGVFFLYLMWASGGFLLHLLLDLKAGKASKPDFKLITYWHRNVYSILASVVAILLSCGLLATSASQIKEFPVLQIMGVGLPYQVYIIILGYTGGASLKKLLKRKEKIQS